MSWANVAGDRALAQMRGEGSVRGLAGVCIGCTGTLGWRVRQVDKRVLFAVHRLQAGALQDEVKWVDRRALEPFKSWLAWIKCMHYNIYQLIGFY